MQGNSHAPLRVSPFSHIKPSEILLSGFHFTFWLLLSRHTYFFKGQWIMKRRPRFYKPVFKYPLGNSLSRIYSGSLRNGDITLKSFSSKCSNHPKQINKAAFLDLFVARGRKPLRLPALPESEACFASLCLLPRSAQADRLCNNLLLANSQTLPGR